MKKILYLILTLASLEISAQASAEEYLKKLSANNMQAIGFGPNRIRITTHLDVTENDIEKAIGIMKNLS